MSEFNINIDGLNNDAYFSDDTLITDGLSGDISINSSIYKSIYISDRLCFNEEKNFGNQSIVINESIGLKTNNNRIDKDSLYNAYDSFFIKDKYLFSNTVQNFYDSFIVRQNNFIIYSNQVVVYDGFGIAQKDYKISDLNVISTFQYIHFHENWCNSDNQENNNIISYYINSDIIVNNVKYNTLNIGRYTFDIRDQFDFFLNSQKKLMQYNNNVKNIYQFDSQLKVSSNIELLQKVQVTNKQYSIISSVDGLILNNRIKLNSGKHKVKIKKLNTTKMFCFEINVVSPYRRQFDKIYLYDLRDLENAKYYSNYQIQQNQVIITNNSVKIS